MIEVKFDAIVGIFQPRDLDFEENLFTSGRSDGKQPIAVDVMTVLDDHVSIFELNALSVETVENGVYAVDAGFNQHSAAGQAGVSHVVRRGGNAAQRAHTETDTADFPEQVGIQYPLTKLDDAPGAAIETAGDPGVAERAAQFAMSRHCAGKRLFDKDGGVELRERVVVRCSHAEWNGEQDDIGLGKGAETRREVANGHVVRFADPLGAMEIFVGDPRNRYLWHRFQHR